MKYIIPLILAIAAGGVLAQSPWVNPGTSSGYAAMYNQATERFDLCWSDVHAHGNCMDVGAVFQIIHEAQMAKQQRDLEESI